MQTKDFRFEYQADEKGKFTGYGSVFGNVDFGGDIVAPGAFAKSLEGLKQSGRSLPILWQHRSGEPIGAWNSLGEDDTGLKGDGALWIDEAPYARIAHKGMQTKSINGLSIGYDVVRDSIDRKSGVRTLHEVNLAEISVVTFPMNTLARVEQVKSALQRGDLPSLSEFEKFLREAGFSKTQAAAIAGKGLAHLLRSESGSESDEAADLLSEVAKYLKGK